MSNIPKIIHYCWFGKGEKNNLIKKCMDSWKKYCPDYEIIEWNEENSNFNDCKYAKEAFEKGKWAFVSDYVRLVALRDYGGIYLDTDVELVSSLDKFANRDEAFVGYAEDLYIGTATIACKKENEWIKLLIEEYHKLKFVDQNGHMTITPNNVIITDVTLRKTDFCIGDQSIKLGNISVYPTEFFSPYKKKIIGKESFFRKNYTITEDTVCIHHTDLSWQTKRDFNIFQQLWRQIVRCILPSKIYWKIKSMIIIKSMGWRDFISYD